MGQYRFLQDLEYHICEADSQVQLTAGFPRGAKDLLFLTCTVISWGQEQS